MPIPLPTKEEQEELERAILEVSKTVTSVQESLDQLSKQSIDHHLSTDNAMFDDHDNSGDSADQDGMDGLPRDLHSAANRLLQDTIRQSSVDVMGAAAAAAAILDARRQAAFNGVDDRFDAVAELTFGAN